MSKLYEGGSKPPSRPIKISEFVEPGRYRTTHLGREINRVKDYDGGGV
jgi:hypothetical protein